MTDANSILAAARGYLGAPFQHQGRSREGMDCVGLLVMVARDLGIQHADFTAYSRNPSPRKMLEALAVSCDRVSGVVGASLERDLSAWDDSRPGDIVVFWFSDVTRPQHVAFRSQRGMLHTWGSVGRVVEHGLTEWWRERVHSVWRYRG